jgi:hypothetical protein
MECQVFTSGYSQCNHDQSAPDADDNASILDDNSFEMQLGDDDNSISAHGSFPAVNTSSETA